jgi:hypothetical protein
MRLLKEVPKHVTSPVRPVFPVEARLDSLRKRQRVVIDLIIEAEQSGAKVAYSDIGSKIEAEALALVREGEAKKPRAASPTLKALLHERAVIERALDLGGVILTEMRISWAQRVMAERSKEYRDAVRNVALAIEALKRADSTMQERLKLFGALGRSSGLPCANVTISPGLNLLKSFTSAALSAGLITKEEI